ncbi:MAG: hypothetical protein FJ291_01025 [Planctomycetes bacterium]|nr:hypothetical protein [Planctomycetota bacterium]
MLTTELPSALTTRLESPGGAFAAMSRAERQLAEDFLGAEEVFLAVRTDSRVDVGSWLGPGRLWAFALRRELALVAHGPRPHTERIPFSRLQESTYNPVTGELVLAPAQHHHARGLRMPPVEGYQLLAQILADRTTE